MDVSLFENRNRPFRAPLSRLTLTPRGTIWYPIGYLIWRMLFNLMGGLFG